MPASNKGKSQSIQLGNYLISKPQAIKENTLVTKVGRISYKGFFEGNPVKVYECHSKKHAEFVQKITNAPESKMYFPHTYGVYNNFIVSEWVSGSIIKPKKFARNANCVKQLKDFIKSLHSFEAESHYGFDYFEDYIDPRFKRCCDTSGLDGFYKRIKEDYLLLKTAHNTSALSHPDITPANIVVTPDGKIKLIDNELLSSSHLPFFDYFNVIHGFGVSLKKNAELWFDLFSPVRPYLTPEYEDALMSLWIMRITGSYFVDGRFDKVLKLAEASYGDLKSNLRMWDILTTVCQK